MTKPRIQTWLVAVLASLALAACSGEDPAQATAVAPVHFDRGDECHVCGMAITRFPGPKGEAITEKDQQVRKFCSTRDMFAWLLQPENVNRAHTLYVHDMAQTDWHSPDDTRLIDARAAYYVSGSARTGAMGPTLASFAQEADAHAFAQAHGGQVLAFSEITMAHLNTGMPMHGEESGMAHPGKDAADHPVEHATDHSMDHN